VLAGLVALTLFSLKESGFWLGFQIPLMEEIKMQICSGCDNECEIGEQYCSECLQEIALEDWIESYDDGEEQPYCEECGSTPDSFGICRNQNCWASPDLGKNWL